MTDYYRKKHLKSHSALHRWGLNNCCCEENKNSIYAQGVTQQK